MEVTAAWSAVAGERVPRLSELLPLQASEKFKPISSSLPSSLKRAQDVARAYHQN